MKKIIIILLAALIMLTACKNQASNDYQIAETLNESCEQDSDCTTPGSYLIRSSCPFTTYCLDDRCTVVCPWPKR